MWTKTIFITYFWGTTSFEKMYGKRHRLSIAESAIIAKHVILSHLLWEVLYVQPLVLSAFVDLALIFRGSLNFANLESFAKNLSHCAVTRMGNTNSRNLFNEFLQNSNSRKFRPAKYKRYMVSYATVQPREGTARWRHTHYAGLGMQSITAESATLCYGLSFAGCSVR